MVVVAPTVPPDSNIENSGQKMIYRIVSWPISIRVLNFLALLLTLSPFYIFKQRFKVEIVIASLWKCQPTSTGSTASNVTTFFTFPYLVNASTFCWHEQTYRTGTSSFLTHVTQPLASPTGDSFSKLKIIHTIFKGHLIYPLKYVLQGKMPWKEIPNNQERIPTAAMRLVKGLGGLTGRLRCLPS